MRTDRKTRPDSRMHHLSQERKDAAFAQCDSLTLTEGVRWLKENLKVSTSRTALGIWLQEQRLERSMSSELTELRTNHQRASSSTPRPAAILS